MKFLLLLIITSISVQFGSAQLTSGIINYEEKINVHRTLPEHMQDRKDRIPEFRTSNFELKFNESESQFSRLKSENDNREYSGNNRDGRRGGRGFRRFGRSDAGGNTYTDLSTGETLSEADIFGKKFLVSGKAEKLSWKMSGEQKQVGDYLCMKATYQDSLRNIEAWFTPNIPVAIGPREFSGLPGLILNVNINKGERVITASDINLQEISSDALIKPSEGKAISQDEFRALMAEKRKEMEAERGNRRGQMGRRFGGRG